MACRPSRAANRAKTGTAGVEPALNDVGVLKRIFRAAQESGTRSMLMTSCVAVFRPMFAQPRGAERGAINP